MKKEDRDNLLKALEAAIIETEEYEVINGRVCFIAKPQGYVRLDAFKLTEDVIVIEYAENIDEALNNRFQDTDLYPASWSEEKLMQAVRAEIVDDLTGIEQW